MKQLDESSNAKEIDLTVGESLEVRLQENRTTGYKWIVDSAGGPECKLVSDSFEAGTAVGQPGTHIWEFRAEKAGSGEIALSYRRPWEEKQQPAHSFTLRVQVSA